MTKTIQGIVSVLVPLYNHSKTVERALVSLLRSNASRIEVIVCDDASTDESFEVASNWIRNHETQFHAAYAVRNSTNLGITGNLNQLMALATGEYVTLLASDDELTESAIDLQADFLAARPCLDFVYANYGTIDVSSQIVCQKVISDRHTAALQRRSCAFVDIVFNWSPAWTRLFGRRVAQTKIGPYPSEYSFEGACRPLDTFIG
jgi:alpha-1,3-rhamnosyltransferase